MLVGAAIIAASVWLSHFFYSMRTPIDQINDYGRAEAQTVGFWVGFIVAAIVTVGIAASSQS